MGVATQLKTDAVTRGVFDLFRLVREQDELTGRIAAFDGTRQIRPVIAAEAARAPIVDAGEIEARLTLSNNDPLVSKHADAERVELLDPIVGARVVLVIAGDEEHAVLCVQIAERRRLIAERRHRAVHEIAGDGDDVGLAR